MTQDLADAALRRRGVRYELAFWVVFVATAVVWTGDRLWTNLWPRQSFGAAVARIATDNTEGFIDGPWSAVLYDVLARCTGRLLIWTTNGLFATMMHTMFNWASEREQGWVDLSGWQEANERIHTVLGWATGALVIAHIWSPWCPVVFEGWSDIRIVWPGAGNGTSVFMFPVTEWKNCSNGHADLDVDEEALCVNSDDLGRLVGMMLLFCVVFPVSRAGWAVRRNFMIAKWVHVVAAGAFAFDLVRRRAHPHTWVMNVPVLVAYLADRAVGWYWYRVGVCEVAGRLRLDDDYSVVYWRMSRECDRAAAHTGDVYWLKAHGSGGVFERLHPFTCMTNRTGEYVPCEESASPKWMHHALVVDDGSAYVEALPVADVAWDVAAVVKVSRGSTRACCGGVAQTPLLADGDTTHVDVMGPYRSSYGVLRSYEALPAHTTLVASGSGAGMLVDFANAVQAWERDPCPAGAGVAPRKRVVVVYTTRSVALLQFVTDRLATSTLVDIDCTHIALTAEGAEFDAQSATRPSPRAADVWRRQRRSSSAVDLREAARAAAMAAAVVTSCGDDDASGVDATLKPAADASTGAEDDGCIHRGTASPSNSACTVDLGDFTRRQSLTLGLPIHDAAVEGVRTARLSLKEIAKTCPAGSPVFFCGSGALLRTVREACEEAGLALQDCHTFDG